METTHPSKPISYIDLAQLRDLLHMNVDSRDGFAYAGKRLAEKHSSLSMRFHRYSQQRNDFLEKLKEIAETNHEEASERGTIAASLHRTWMELRDELNEAVDVSAVIVEAERGESYIKQAYETAIGTVIEPRLESLLTHQYQSIKESYAWLVGLCEEDERRKGLATAPSSIEQQKETL
jgi:uncharacterized protein (TIGR02284 family)